MTQKTWHDYFDEDPDEKIGRSVEGIFGESIFVVMPRISWAYLDWAKEKLGGDTEKFIKYVERVRRPNDGERNDIFTDAVRQVYLRFEKEGKPRPPWCAAADPDDFDELENLEKRE